MLMIGHTICIQIIDEYMPRKKMRVRDKDVPYETRKWKAEIRMRRKAARQFEKKLKLLRTGN